MGYHKGAFRDALCLRYGWCSQWLPSQCVCNQIFTIKHAMSCPRWGFPSVWRNQIRNITAEFLTEICHGVGTKSCLQPVRLTHRSTIREDGACLNIVAGVMISNVHFFDVRLFNSFAPSYCSTNLTQCYHRNELEKRRAYDERVREIEYGSFSPSFSTAAGMGAMAKVVYKWIASLTVDKHNMPNNRTINWHRCRLTFSLPCSAVMCLCGSRSFHPPPNKLIYSLGKLIWPLLKARFLSEHNIFLF